MSTLLDPLDGGGSSSSSTSNAGFYGITVGQTNDNPIYKNINTIKFESQFFYLSQNDTDTAIVSLRPPAAGAGTGEANTASNLGAGTGVFASKSGVDLQFKSLLAGPNITFSNTANDITVGVQGLGFYGITVGQTDDNPSYKNINTVKFEKNFFYITQNDTDSAIVSFRPPATVISRFQQLATFTPVNAASVDIALPSGFMKYSVDVDLLPSTDDVELWLRTSPTSGTPFDQGATDYIFGQSCAVSNATVTNFGSTGTTALKAGEDAGGLSVGNAASRGISGTFMIERVGDANLNPMVRWDLTYLDSTGRTLSARGAGVRAAAGPVRGVQILFEAGNLTGTVKLSGTPT